VAQSLPLSPAEVPESRKVPATQARPLGVGALVVVPTYDEVGNLRDLVESVLRVAPAAHVLIVDDASPDGTGRLASQMAAQDARVHVLHRPGKLGLGTAYVDGFKWGLARGYEQLFEMDADFSHDPRELPRLFAALSAGADVALGSRNIAGGVVSGWGPFRLFLSKGGSAYARAVLGVGVRDMTTGYKAFSRAALETLPLDSVCSNGYAFQVELTYRALCAGMRVVEVPITFVDRRAGQSKMDGRIFLEAVGVVWRLRVGSLLRARECGSQSRADRDRSETGA
jgi:dolichol-phosphate mannosyltransferase